jgi:site-specific DNA-methyltransferase (adenine-specific)
MLDRIPEEMFVSDTKTFLDPSMGGGQFIKGLISRLRKYSHSDDNIASRITGYENNKMRIQFAVNKYNLIGTFEAKDFLEEEDEDMKFDVILGNPPFQSGSASKGNKLWPKFILKASQLSNPGGYVAMITPAGWAAGGTNIPGGKGIIKDVFQTYNLKYASFKDLNKFFPNIGISFSYFLLENSKPTKSTIIETDDETINLDITSIDFLPDSINSTSISIFKKLFTHVPFDIISFDRQKDKNKTDDKSDVNVIKHWVLGSGDKIQYCYLPYEKTPKLVGVRKVLFPIRKFSNKPMIHIDDEGIPVCQQGFLLAIDDNHTVENVSSVWNSALYRFMVVCIHPTGFLKTNIVKRIPYVDMSRAWTDTELYDYFDLTQEERTYIEENVK